MDVGFPFSRSRGSAADKSSLNRAHASAIMKWRQPFTPLHETAGGAENEDKKGPTMNPGRPRDAYSAVAFAAGIGLERKKCSRGQRKSLKRLDSAKGIRGFELDFPSTRLDFPSPGLDFPSEN